MPTSIGWRFQKEQAKKIYFMKVGGGCLFVMLTARLAPIHGVSSAMTHARSIVVRQRWRPRALLTSFALFWFSYTVADPDLWGHIRFGQDILRTGSIIQSDVYSYRSAGQRWINHEWLSEVMFAGIYNFAGPCGLIVAKVLLSLVVIGLCHVHLTRSGLGPFRSVGLLILASIPFRLGLGTIRPQTLHVSRFPALLLLLERASRAASVYLWALPVIVASLGQSARRRARRYRRSGIVDRCSDD